MVFGKFRFQNWLQFSLGSVILLLVGQQHAIASLTVPTETPLLLNLPTIEPPEVPPLGEPDAFLPSVERLLHVVVKLTERRLYVYQDEQLQVSYPIAVGKPEWETPTGSFEVTQMVRDPAWEHPWSGEVVPPGEDNPLGSRWIGFWTDGRNQIGFHGTPDESVIGQAISHGCVRMRDQDVRALFDVVSVGTAVIVEP
ncbi:L,D-transpeptidase [Coleofasciculus sp. LEGE 07092]|nr:L,D-transpeptidase [Coleofasciculus sp. LEGE 07081]MBE9151147.1 L,D-transpeptidase [Coleofasciculus sp. LEGE 07092]